MGRVVILALILLAPACDWDFERMIDQPKFEPYEANPYFPDGTTMQWPPPGTVSVGSVTGPPELVRGRTAAGYVEEPPLPLTRELVDRGRNRYDIYCAACHGLSGYADTQVAENMKLRPPRSLHDPAVRDYPIGRLFQVASDGFGVMPSYRDELSLRDRWAVVAYIQALQLSQNVRATEMSADVLEEVVPWRR